MVPRLSVLPPARRLPASRRLRFFLIAGAAVVLLHALLLTTLAPAWIDPEDVVAAAPVLNVRSVTAAAPVAAPAPAHAVAQPPAAPRPVPPRRPPRPAPPPQAAPEPIPQEVASAPSVAMPADLTPAASVIEAAAAPPPDGAERQPAIEVPVYETRLPAAGSWRYLLQRGIASGQAQLSWEPDAQQGYAMRLEGWIAGVTVLDWVSSGTLDHAGIAPQRFVIRRRGRDSQAANFQRDAGKVTFSGPTYELPLLPGVQDRLSWMLQLPAVIDAAPQRFGAGTSVVLMVVGARGGADVWTFDVVGTEPWDGAPALKLVREARKPRDLRVQVWLDPARAHLPVRALLTQPEGGAPLELQLQKGSTGP